MCVGHVWEAQKVKDTSGITKQISHSHTELNFASIVFRIPSTPSSTQLSCQRDMLLPPTGAFFTIIFLFS